jgi:hypothetical protein
MGNVVMGDVVRGDVVKGDVSSRKLRREQTPRRPGRWRGAQPGGAALLIVSIAALVITVVVMQADQGPAAKTAPPTFAADIAPIVYKNCVTCHRPGQAAPFSLVSYADVRKHGEDMADATANRYMPPWHASRAEGFPEFVGERRLTQGDLDKIQAWVTAGMPSGDLSQAPAPPVFTSGWALGKPDLVLRFAKPVSIGAEGRDQYRNVTLPVDLPDDRWITAIDYQPSARSVVHHALYFTTPAGTEVGDNEAVPGLGGLAGRLGGGLLGGRSGGEGVGGGGLAGGRGRLGAGRAGGADTVGALGAANDAWGGLGGWVPGVTPRFFPEGIAQPLPRNTNLVLQLHLHPTGKAEAENGEIAIYFSKTPPKRSLTGVQVPPAFGVGAGIDIPAGESRYVVRDSFVLPVGVEAFGVRGHAHYLAHEMKMTATLPDGSVRGLLWIKDWDFSWQDSYFYQSAFALPTGTRIATEIVYDNSVDNIRNPNSPPKRVRWGRESFDEMGSMTLLVTTPTPEEGQALRAAQTAHLRDQILGRLRGR